MSSSIGSMCRSEWNTNSCRWCITASTRKLLTDCCIPISDVASRRHLRSASRHHLVVPRHNLSTYGRRAFAVAGPAAWNSNLCDPVLSTDSFRCLLKTLLQSASTSSALEVLHIMRYTNLRLTYLFTYLTIQKENSRPSLRRDRSLSVSSSSAVFWVLRTPTYISRSVRDAFSVSRLQFSSRIYSISTTITHHVSRMSAHHSAVWIPASDTSRTFTGHWREKETGTATHSCWTRKCTFHFYSPGVIRCSHTAVHHVRALSYVHCHCCCWRCCAEAIWWLHINFVTQLWLNLKIQHGTN